MVNSSVTEFLRLPVVGQTLHDDDRTIQDEEYVISGQTTMALLKERLASYGLAKSGSREQLINRLRDFSHDKDSWASIFQPCVKKRRGDITGARKSKFSSQRILTQFGEPSEQSEFRSKKGTIERVPQHLTAAAIERNNEWASAVLNHSQWPQNHGSTSQHLPVEATGGMLAAPDADITATETASVNSGQNPDNIRLRRLERSVSGLAHSLETRYCGLEKVVRDSLEQAIHDVASMQSQPPVINPPAAVSYLSHSQEAAPRADVSLAAAAAHKARVELVHQGASPSQAHTLPAAVINPDHLAYAQLGEEQLAYDRTTVPDPPTMHFSADIPALFVHWNVSDLFVVNGRGIPIKFWPEFFKKKKHIKQSAWDLTRTVWGNWKFIVEEREQHPNEDAFWAKFSDSTGNRFKYQEILNALKANRKDRDEQDVRDALRCFNGNLGSVEAGAAFKYKASKSGNQMVVLTKSLDIAKRWRDLLAQNDDIATRWSKMQTDGSNI